MDGGPASSAEQDVALMGHGGGHDSEDSAL